MNWYRKNSFFLFVLITFCVIQTGCSTKNEANIDQQVVVATMGASLMDPGNGWVEYACTQAGAKCMNKAVSGEMVYDFAYKLWKEEYATPAELQEIDILLIQFANCKDIYGDEATLYATAEEYIANLDTAISKPFKKYSYAQSMDYILKKWQQICNQYNKPMHVLFVTHWHDARTTYNTAVRQLAERWNTEVVELDCNIGFTKEIPDSDGRQPSIKYAVNTEKINGIEYGWHPLRGDKGTYIQNKMASILYDKLISYIAEHDIQ